MPVSPWVYLIAYLVPGLFAVGLFLHGLFLWMTPVFVFGLVPLLDLVVGPTHVNLAETEYRRMRDALPFRLLTHAYVPFQFILLVWGAAVFARQPLGLLEQLGLIFSMGTVSGGLGITLAHELGHRSSRLERLLSKTLLMSVCYMHFFIEHNHGHHARVATPDDPATARRGESIFQFLPRTLTGSFRHAWDLEQQRLAKRGLPWRSPRNQMIWFVLLPLVLAAWLGLVFGWSACLYFFGQSAVAVGLLELVNYVEHYGLTREARPGDGYEPVKAHHAWNAGEWITNGLLFNLQRHADHHLHANRRFQTLRHQPQSPQLPTGYAGMILIALLPPLWRRIMDPRLKQAKIGSH